MDVIGKTPVSFLQEICVRKHCIPEYNLIHNGMGTAKPIFTYELLCNGYIVQGTGSSKKDAKHYAAYNMLNLIEMKPEFDNNEISRFLGLLRTSNQNPELDMSTKINSIGQLDEFCNLHQLQLPEYVLEREEGPSHAKSFTVRCSLFGITKEAVGSTKKQAKQLAASNMHAWLKDIVKYEATCRNSFNIEKEQFLDICMIFPPRRPILSLTLNNLDQCLSETYMLSPTLDELMPDYKKDHFLKGEETGINNFKIVISQLCHNYRIKNVPSCKADHMVIITIDSIPELSCIGRGETLTEAKDNAAINMLKTICAFYEKRQPSPPNLQKIYYVHDKIN